MSGQPQSSLPISSGDWETPPIESGEFPPRRPRAPDNWTTRFATWFGAGYSRIAPGTVGSLGAIPAHFLLRALGPVPHLSGVLLVCGVGIYAADRTAKAIGLKDPQIVVIDEVAGTLIALGLAGRGFRNKALSLILFRVLDVTKPGLIDRLQHARPLGLGIMADDFLAGALAGLAARLLKRG